MLKSERVNIAVVKCTWKYNCQQPSTFETISPHIIIFSNEDKEKNLVVYTYLTFLHVYGYNVTECVPFYVDYCMHVIIL